MSIESQCTQKRASTKDNSNVEALTQGLKALDEFSSLTQFIEVGYLEARRTHLAANESSGGSSRGRTAP